MADAGRPGGGAPAADAAGVPVLHYDADFDLISEVSGIDTRWVRPRGSLE